MSEPKFTKGPWTANFEDYTKPYVEILNEDNLVIAQIPDGEIIRGDKTILGLENIEANIDLIATAPDMYEALEEVIRIYNFKEMVRVGRTLNSPKDDPDRGKIFFTYNDLSKARDALRKARGEAE